MIDWLTLFVGLAGALVGVAVLVLRHRDASMGTLGRLLVIVGSAALFVLILHLIVTYRPEWLAGAGLELPASTPVGVTFWPYVAVALIGGLVGMAELVSRYRDDPWRAISRVPALIYIAFNAGASILALFLILQIKPAWLIGEAGDVSAVTPAGWITIVSVAGTAALAFFRSSLFRAKIDDATVPIGPALILDGLLSAIDRTVDREIATPRSDAIARIMANVDFDKAQDALSAYCLALMQNLSQEDSQRLADQLNRIKASNVPNDIKVLNLGLALLNTFGEDVLGRACTALSEHIHRTPPLKGQRVADLPRVTAQLDYDRARESLPIYALALASATAAVQAQIQGDLEGLDAAPLANKTKLLMLGLILSRSLGMDTLELAIEHLQDEISKSAPPGGAGT